MKVEYFASTNLKGQVVIPKKLRDDLNISSSVLLHILKRGNGFYVYPIKEVIGLDPIDTSYLDILSKTKGSWDSDSSLGNKSNIELKASQARKQAW